MGLTNRRNRLFRQARLLRGRSRAFLRAVHLNVRQPQYNMRKNQAQGFILSSAIFLVIGLTGLRAQVQVSVSAPPLTLANVSCRAYVGTNSNVAIAGFVVTGQSTVGTFVLIRAVGPSLASFGVTGVLAQPVLTLFDASGRVLATNTGWGTNTTWPTTLVSTSYTTFGAFALPLGSADSALLVALLPGTYTAAVSGLNGSTGIALLEVYMPQPLPASAVPPPPVPPAQVTPGTGSG
jgi:hypothetical protein